MWCVVLIEARPLSTSYLVRRVAGTYRARAKFKNNCGFKEKLTVNANCLNTSSISVRFLYQFLNERTGRENLITLLSLKIQVKFYSCREGPNAEGNSHDDAI